MCSSDLIDSLNLIVANISKPLELIGNSKEFQTQKLILLEENTTKTIWQNKFHFQDNKRNKIRIVFLDKVIFLSQREIQCFALVGLGLSNKSIANELNISDLTVKDYVVKLKNKFSVNTRDNLNFIARKPEIGRASCRERV